MANPHSTPTTPPLDGLISQVRAVLSGNPHLFDAFANHTLQFAVNLAEAGLILAVTLLLARWAGRFARRTVPTLAGGADATLPTFLGSLLRWAIIAIGIAAAVEQMGVKTTSVLAVLGAASLAVGLALQGALGNVAAGVMILIMRPYRIGDVVEINGKVGTVKKLDLFTTELADFDNLDIYVPNSKIVGDIIVNYSNARERRMELMFRVAYEDDLDAALDVVLATAKADKRILPKPEPWARVTALGDSNVTLTLRAWAKAPDYWDARFDMIKRVKEALDRAGLSVPYPHQVQVEKPKPAAAKARPAAPIAAAKRRRTSSSPGSDEPV
jgi:small conductance mechanosensitive channel